MPGLRDFKKVAGADEDVAKLQERLQEFFAPLLANPMLDGALLQNIALNSNVTQVPHKLQRPFSGWIVVRKTADENVWEPTRVAGSSFINLQASGAVTVDLWVF